MADIFDTLDRPNQGRPHPSTGHYREKPGYAVERRAGMNDWLLIYTVSGVGKITHPDGDFCVKSHDVVLIQPYSAHRYETNVKPDGRGRWELLWAHFMPSVSWVNWLDWPYAGPGIMHLSIGDRRARRSIIAALKRMHELSTSFLHHREPLALGALAEAILWCREQSPAATTAALDDRVRRAIEWIMEHLEQSLTVEQVAGQANLSVSRFAHLFREQMGHSPQQFIELQRIARARELLERTALPVGEVAGRIGFDQPFYFSRRFKHVTGMTPRDYRLQFGSR